MATASRSRKRTRSTTVSKAAKTARRAVKTAATSIADRVLPAGPHDAIKLLEKDHRRFEQLLKQGEETTENAVKGRTELLKTITAELNVHELIEEKILYPALRLHPEAKDIVLESFQEHHVADQLVTELHKLEKDDEKWGAKFKVLKENVTHHISDEENKLFPVARGVLEKEELLALGAKMRALRSQLER